MVNERSQRARLGNNSRWRCAASGEAWERRKRCRKHHRNLSLESCGQPIPPGRAWRAAGSASGVVWEQSRLRSVDSERLGPAIEPRKKTILWEPSSSHQRGPRRRAVATWHVVPAGVKEQGTSAKGFSRNLRDPIVSTVRAGRGDRLINPRLAGTVFPCGSEMRHGNRGSAKRRKRSAASGAVGSRSAS
jgi:hypothetical protein